MCKIVIDTVFCVKSGYNRVHAHSDRRKVQTLKKEIMMTAAISIQAAVRRANKAVFVNSKAAVVKAALMLLGVAYEAAHNFSCAVFDSKKSVTALVKRFFEVEAEKAAEAAGAEAARVAAEAKAKALADAAESRAAAKFTAKNLDSYVGETVSIKNGFFTVSPWHRQMPTSSARFGLKDVPDGTYKITKKKSESENDGSAVTYTLVAS